MKVYDGRVGGIVDDQDHGARIDEIIRKSDEKREKKRESEAKTYVFWMFVTFFAVMFVTHAIAFGIGRQYQARDKCQKRAEVTHTTTTQNADGTTSTKSYTQLECVLEIP